MPHPQTEGPTQGQPISPEEMALRAMVEDLMRANPGMTPEEALPIAQARMEAGQPLQANTLAQAGSRIVSPSVERPPVEARGGGGVTFGAPQDVLPAITPPQVPREQLIASRGLIGQGALPKSKLVGPTLQPGVVPLLERPRSPYYFAEGGGVGLGGSLQAAQGGFVPRTLEQHGEAISAMFQPLK